MPILLRSTLSLLFALCATLATAQNGPPPNGDYKLGPGDAIRVQVYQNPWRLACPKAARSTTR
jgi:protein involved in polysaccharide export with SLBB domain